MDTAPIGAFDEELAIEVARSAKAAGREPGNIEDQIRSATELLRGLEILCADPNSEHSRMLPIDALRHGLTACLTNFVASILHGERNILEANAQQREMAFNYLINFLMSFASRSGTRERLNIYTTNYDRFLELGADLAGLRLIDRFVGTLAPVFRTSRLDVDFHYNPPGIRGEPRYLEGVARFTKLHGSIDWLDDDGAIRRLSLPFGTEDVTPFLARPARQSTDARQLMIYPNAAKDRETSFFPYAELFRDFATSICRPNSTLVSYGYSFGDEHINRVIADMLTIPSSHLVIIAYSDPLRRIINTYEELGRPSQVTLLLGDHVADLRTLVDLYLPKSAIDRTTSRMAELLRSRLGTEQVGNTAYDSEADLEATHVDEGGER